MENIKIFRRNKSVPLPARMTSGAVGFDIYTEKETLIPLEKVTFIETGLIIKIPLGYHIKLFLRSSMAVKHYLTLMNNVGIIDEDYCGESDFIKLVVMRHKKHDFSDLTDLVIKEGERVGQIIFEKSEMLNLTWDEQTEPHFSGTSRGGYGSTGA
jgi:dUTP pyrophosphatase